MRHFIFFLVISMTLGLFGWYADQVIAQETPLENQETVKAKEEAPAEVGAEEKKPAVEEKIVPKKAKIARLKISGFLNESAGGFGIFGDIQPNLRDMIRRLDRAASDKNISAVILRPRNLTIGRGKLAELRATIARIRDSGKKVYAEIQMASTADYLVASACDRIIMPESGTLMIPGVRAELTFFKGLFDKLGVDAQFVQVGDFKGAAEPYTRTGMSPEFRKQYENLIDDFYMQMVESISKDRNLEQEKVKEILDTGFFTPRDALKAGLIDRIAYTADDGPAIKQDLSVDSISMDDEYGKKRVDTDFSGMMGMMKLFELMMGTNTSQLTSKKKKIALIYAVGTIMTGSSTSGILGGESLGSDTIVKAVRRAAKDKTVSAIVLRVDSPGGSALASDLIWREIRQTEKPVVASMGDTAASGGYYISVACDKIVAEPGTLTGSIGVVGGKFAIKGLYDRLGLSTEVISRGKNSGVLSISESFSAEQKKVFQTLLDDTYSQFLGKVAQGRNMEEDKVKSLAGGRVWTGRQAEENGLIDQLGTLHDAINTAKELAGIDENEKTELLVLPEPKSFLDQLIEGPSVQSPIASSLEKATAGASKLLQQAEAMKQLFSEPAVMVLPYRVEIK